MKLYKCLKCNRVHSVPDYRTVNKIQGSEVFLLGFRCNPEVKRGILLDDRFPHCENFTHLEKNQEV